MQNFDRLIDGVIAVEEQSLKARGRNASIASFRPVIEKEVLHYDILNALDRSGLMQGLTFQGGTSLRLCYRAPRFSEDLDFVGGVDFTSTDLGRISECIQDHIGGRYGLEVNVKDPSEVAKEPTYQGMKTDRWQVSVITQAQRRDIPHQKIKVEVSNVPSYTREITFLDKNYAALPDSFADISVPVETKDEILADKLVSLPACTKYTRYRDIWDILWLMRNQATVNTDLVARKIGDYNPDNYPLQLANMISNLPAIISSEKFHKEMSRFLAPDVRENSLEKEGFLAYMTKSVVGSLSRVDEALYKDKAPQEEGDAFDF